MLKIRNLKKTYKTGDEALKSVDIDSPTSQVMALIGPSGAGKSTLIRCINRLVEPTNGQVFLNDLDLTKLSRRKLRFARRRIGMIFQEYALVERLTVMENVLSGRLGFVGFWSSFYRRFPKENEGFMTEKKIALVKNESIGRMAYEMGLNKWYIISANAEEIRQAAQAWRREKTGSTGSASA